MEEILLASASPRRAELLRRLGVPFFPCPMDVDERVSGAPEDCVRELAQRKAAAAAKAHPGIWVLAADTLVFLDGEPLGKPGTEERAREMLHRLSGRAHEVLTGLCLLRGETVFTRVDGAKVFFDEMTEEEIAAYARTGEPLDKAGGYGIQGLGGQFVRRIEGDYYATVGLSLCGLRRLMQSAGIGKER